MEFSAEFKGKVALVAGIGCGIGCMLGDAGATVYCSGRSLRGLPSELHRPDTMEETAEMLPTRGGIGIFVQLDHTNQEQVTALFEYISEKQQGKLTSEYGFYDLDGTQTRWCN